ncbi:MAG TPA: glycosyl hydrolase family 8 [Noviherbaspirillum sp.]|nr:glycosyl hydrolase family 8 [Noviherbaspirillum sp.]
MGSHPMFVRLFAGRGKAARLLLFAALLLSIPAHAADSDWHVFRKVFIDAEGRVVDSGQDGISHSEGQGFAMLFATHYGDRPAFDSLWRWTQRHLQVREDKLFAWRWHPGQGVTDRNNAADADLLIAWSLLRAGEKWGVPAYLEEAGAIARDIRARLLRRTTHGLILLPGTEGFDSADGAKVNPSYWVFPALRELHRADPSGEWPELAGSGIALLQYARFGRWGLPPDWLQLAEKVVPASGFPERFGYDAVRIPLYLLWSRQESQALLQPYRAFWSYFAGARFLPAWTNLRDDSVDSHDALPGIKGIAQWLAEGDAVRLPAVDPSHHYYSAALLLLCKMAIAERRGS